ncbi:MAG: hypothetical protein HC840_12265 [Leptolyngbyaceae cyanobacterium RM2_2_4]|nr:hypothetical protein [Leptolyngbyaceae cyanobacterium RM2_2_4]
MTIHQFPEQLVGFMGNALDVAFGDARASFFVNLAGKGNEATDALSLFQVDLGAIALFCQCPKRRQLVI